MQARGYADAKADADKDGDADANRIRIKNMPHPPHHMVGDIIKKILLEEIPFSKGGNNNVDKSYFHWLYHST